MVVELRCRNGHKVIVSEARRHAEVHCPVCAAPVDAPAEQWDGLPRPSAPSRLETPAESTASSQTPSEAGPPPTSGSPETGTGTAQLAPTERGSRNIGEPVPVSGEPVRGPGARFGRYRIVKELGMGRMGVVYLAEDEQMGRQVALKMPNFPPRETQEALGRFYREARAAGTLRHPNLCPVYDVGEIDGQHYMTMAYLEGRLLSEFIDPRRLPAPRNAVVLVRKLALALEDAHAKGVIHRDLKPDNIMITPNKEPVIMDFGLAWLASSKDSRLTRQGRLIGSPAYMSPEQIAGDAEAIGPACDVYSLGVILYELLTGQVPFRGTLPAVLMAIARQEPEPPSKLRPQIDSELEATCLRAIAKRREDRFPTMSAFSKSLADYLRGH